MITLTPVEVCEKVVNERTFLYVLPVGENSQGTPLYQFSRRVATSQANQAWTLVDMFSASAVTTVTRELQRKYPDKLDKWLSWPLQTIVQKSLKLVA